GLPSDREALRKLARAKRGTNLDAVLEHFESDGNGHLFNRKLHEQWKDSVRFYSGKADAGREGGIASGIARSKAKAELEANTKQSLSTASSKHKASSERERGREIPSSESRKEEDLGRRVDAEAATSEA